MPLIAMNREMGSLGKDVANALAQALGLKIQHHEIIDHLANRARIRKSHVISFLEGTQGILERLTVDNLKLRILTADEILSLAESHDGIILRGWGASSLLKEVPHAGFGLGFERTLAYVTGLSNVRDAIPVPRTPGNAKY